MCAACSHGSYYIPEFASFLRHAGVVTSSGGLKIAAMVSFVTANSGGSSSGSAVLLNVMLFKLLNRGKAWRDSRAASMLAIANGWCSGRWRNDDNS